MPGTKCEDAPAAPDLPAALRATVASLTTMLNNHVPPMLNKRLATGMGTITRREGALVRTADRYIAARLANQHGQLLGLVAPDVTLTSSRDGTHRGRAEFLRYLRRVPPTGKWERATWNAKQQKAEVRGVVKIVFVNVGVIARFGFDRRGKIRDIYVGTKKRQ